MSWLSLRLLITAKALWAPTALGAAGLVLDARGHVLLVRHSYKRGWCLPVGGVNRGEPAHDAALRELGEEVGLSGGNAAFIGLYTRRAGWATNVVALYRVTGAAVDFHPNWEVREILWADPHDPPPGTTRATMRRLAELSGRALVSPYW
jgi:8-oxo-dGTP pyrophosphatase MutT (NUDIX family)